MEIHYGIIKKKNYYTSRRKKDRNPSFITKII